MISRKVLFLGVVILSGLLGGNVLRADDRALECAARLLFYARDAYFYVESQRHSDVAILNKEEEIFFFHNRPFYRPKALYIGLTQYFHWYVIVGHLRFEENKEILNLARLPEGQVFPANRGLLFRLEVDADSLGRVVEWIEANHGRPSSQSCFAPIFHTLNAVGVTAPLSSPKSDSNSPGIISTPYFSTR